MRLVHSYSPLQEVCVLFDNKDAPLAIMADVPEEIPVGSICCAKVLKVLGSACFVEIEKNVTAYMNLSKKFITFDGEFVERKLSEADFLLVQVTRPKVEDKEMEVSARLSVSLESFENKKERKTGVLFSPEKTVFQWAEKYQTELDEIVTDSSEVAKKLKTHFSEVVFSPFSVWEKEGVGEAVEEALKIKSLLASGGSLMTEQTAACVCFDVNSGTSALRLANEEACQEILHQIALKGLGGQMIIDFAGRKEPQFLKQMMNRLRTENVKVCGFSSLGLVELIVRKNRPSVFDLFLQKGKSFAIATSLARKLWFGVLSASTLKVQAPSAVLNFLRPFLNVFEERLGVEIKLELCDEIKIEGIKE